MGDNSTNMEDRLHNALEGLEIAEYDGKPVPIKGHSYLFVGSVGT
jgi:hypothetical protein